MFWLFSVRVFIKRVDAFRSDIFNRISSKLPAIQPINDRLSHTRTLHSKRKPPKFAFVYSFIVNGKTVAKRGSFCCENVATNRKKKTIQIAQLNEKTSVKQMKFVVRLVVIKFSILQNAFSELTKTLLCCTHIVDEPKIANRGGRRMQQQNEVTCTQMACVSVQIECLGCRFFDAVQTHQVDVKDKPKINVRSPKCATRKQNTHRSRTCPHGWDEIMGHTLRSSFSLQPFSLVCDVRVLFSWLGKPPNEIACKMDFCKRDTTQRYISSAFPRSLMAEQGK